MTDEQIRNIVEAALMVAGRPLNLDGLLALFGEEGRPERSQIRAVVEELRETYKERGIELKEVASGYRIQVRQELSECLSRLWQERPPRYSRALMETLALIAYRQPITRGEIEDVRGVSVSSNIVRTLLERSWIKVLGHRDVPGKPAMFGTTREFLDNFGLKKLDELPTLAEIRDIDSINVELDLSDPREAATDELVDVAALIEEQSVSDEHDSSETDPSPESIRIIEDTESETQESEERSEAPTNP